MGGLVWLASYPKSGNTWARIFLHNLIRGTDESYDINKINVLSAGDSNVDWYEDFLDKPAEKCTEEEIAPLRPKVHQKIADLTPGLVFIKTHNALVEDRGTPMITVPLTAGAIYIVRNPLDVTISYSHHLGKDLDGTIKQMNRRGASSANSDKQVYQVMSSWSEHVMSWTKKHHPSMFVMRYEDMLEEPLKTFGNLAEFLYLRPTRKQLERAIENASFDKLRLQEEEHGFVERPEGAQRFFREGRAGQWRDVLSRKQVRAIVRVHHEQMARFDYLPEGE